MASVLLHRPHMVRFLCVLWLVACTTESAEPPLVGGVMQYRFPVAASAPIDVLVVIDSSPAMAEHEARLRTNLGYLGETLRAAYPDLRLGVVTACADDGAALRTMPGLEGNFLVDAPADDGTALRNYAGTLADAVQRLGDVGTTGCAAAPIEAVRRAIENPANRAFVRPAGHFAVIFVTATDAPESLATVDHTAQVLKSVRGGEPSRVSVGAITRAASDGDRDAFAALLSHFPHRTGRAAITDADWTHGFALTSAFHMSLVGPPCIDALDLDDDTPGPQYACTAWYELPAGTRTLPACDQVGTGTCWRLASHSPRCGLAELVHEVVLEQPLRHVPAGTQLALDCVSR